MLLRKVRIGIGAAIWIGLLAWAGFRYLPAWFHNRSPAAEALTTFVVQPPRIRTLSFKYPSNVRIGDPVFFDNGTRLIQVGAVRQVESPDSQDYRLVWCDWASATFFSTAPTLQPRDYLTFHQTPESMDWVLRFLFPPERRQRIAELVADVYARHSDEILNELLPVLQSVWTEISVMIRDELMASLARHQAEFEALGRRYQQEIVDAELIPLLGEEIWPIVRRHAEPVMESVGQQMWQRASVFRFGWRALYDASPLPERNLTQAEFARFVETEAIPILSDHLPQFLQAQQIILEEIVSNPAVQQVVTGSLQQIGDDPRLQQLLLQILQESILENRKLQAALQDVWQRPDLQQVLALTDQRLEPAVVQIGEEIFGSPYTGVTPEFARILRNKVLLKDRRWFILHQPGPDEEVDPLVPANQDPGTLIVLRGDSTMENPFYYPAKKR
jgi:hypothetical protein